MSSSDIVMTPTLMVTALKTASTSTSMIDEALNTSTAAAALSETTSIVAISVSLGILIAISASVTLIVIILCLRWKHKLRKYQQQDLAEIHIK